MLDSLEGEVNRLDINLENCYGIPSLVATFDYSKSHTNIIYASNGSMKTSLSNTFKRVAVGAQPEEKLYGRIPKADIKIDGKPILADTIFVIEPFDESYLSKNISTLLVNPEMKAEYDASFETIATARSKLVTQLNKFSKVKKDDLESTILRDFNSKNLFELLVSLKSTIDTADDLGSIVYSVVFDQKVLDLLAQENVAENFAAYAEKYNELVRTVGYYSKGGFTPVKADNVVKTLEKEKYFEAKNTIVLNGKSGPISTAKDFQRQIEEDKSRILQNPELKKISDTVITSVASVKAFQEAIEANPEIVPELADLEAFRKRLWISYFKASSQLVHECADAFTNGQARMKAIEERAKIEQTKWFEVKQIFKQRFEVPFEIEIQDQVNTILGTKSPNIVFVFTDEHTGAKKTFTKDGIQSLRILSQGERRALYLLYVIFEVESRRTASATTLFVIDDIADSFDYRNKYAIIEYLKEMDDENFFYLLVLSHNFDFFRTVQTRIIGSARWENSYITLKDEVAISLVHGGSKETSSPFDFWKTQVKSNDSMLIACIPFVRNLIEYKEGDKHKDFTLLTSLLHIKSNPDTHSICLADLESTFRVYINGMDLGIVGRESVKVFDFVLLTADTIVASGKKETAEIDIKVTLSIAIRLLAETYMWANVTDKTPINGSQTGRLYDRFKQQYSKNTSMESVIKTLSAVNLMTPENIHLNSFMYEPILDMSNHHLIELYSKVKRL